MQHDYERTGPFPIYIPNDRPRSLAEVLPGAAIVGFALEADPSTIHVYYEGNRFGSASMRRFADRVRFAAGRCRWFRLNVDDWQRDHPDRPLPVAEYGYVGYPTTAQALVPVADLREVASYDDTLGIVTPISTEHDRLLRAWIGSQQPDEYLASGAVFERRRAGLIGDGHALDDA
jgi:hypothetical protein